MTNKELIKLAAKAQKYKPQTQKLLDDLLDGTAHLMKDAYEKDPEIVPMIRGMLSCLVIEFEGRLIAGDCSGEDDLAMAKNIYKELLGEMIEKSFREMQEEDRMTDELNN